MGTKLDGFKNLYDQLVLDFVGFKNGIDLTKCSQDLKIVSEDIIEEMTKHPSLYFYWSEQATNVRYLYDRFKVLSELVERETEMKVRKELVSAKDKVREGEITSLVKTDDLLVDVKHWVTESKRLDNILSGLLDSLNAKKDMLINISAYKRDLARQYIT